MIEKSVIEEVKKIPITQFLQMSGYDLGKETRARQRFLYKKCPLCNSTSPKHDDNGHFFINKDTNTYCSFTNCGKKRGGDVINLYMELQEKIDFRTAVENLAIENGIIKNKYRS